MENGTNQKWVRFIYVIIIIVCALLIANGVKDVMQKAPETQQEQTVPTASDEGSCLYRPYR